MGDMYAPRPPRPKKTNIVRSRTGCYTCRRRRIKCDETKPECRYCLRLGIKCEGFAPRYSFLDTTAATRMRVNKTESQSTVPPQERPRSGVEDTSHVTTPDEHDEIRGQRAHDGPVGLPPIAALLPPKVWPIPHSPEAARNQLEAWEMSTTFETPSSTQTWSQNSTPSTPSAAADRVAIVPAALPSDSPTYLARVRTPSPHDSAYMSTLPDFPFHAKRYMAHFLSYVCRLLPPAFLELKNLAFDFPVLRDAAIALAASNLAHLQASARRLTTDGGNRVVVASPDSCHMSYGLKFYEQAVKKLSTGLTEDSHSLGLMLAASLLLAEFEFESGTPKAYFTHIDGANALVASKHVSISRTSLGQQILASWASVQNRCSFSKLPFRSLDVESGSYQTVFITLDIRHLKQRYASREAQVLNCLVDCHRIHTRVVLECCMRNGGEDASETMRRSVAWYSQKFNYPYATDNDSRPDRRVVPGDVLIHTLADQRMRLDAWHDTLSIDELPIESFKAQDLDDQNHRFADGSLFIRPIEFRSNTAALTYMYYAFAQLLSSGQALRELNSPIHPSESQQPRVISPWVILILRIALGMVGSKTWAIEETTYRVGLLRILFEVALCCPDERPITYIIDTLLSRMEAAANCPTSSIDLTKWKKWLIVLLDQLKVGKEIYSLASKRPPNTEVLAPDSDANNEEWIAIHGRSRGGSFFNDLIRVS